MFRDVPDVKVSLWKIRRSYLSHKEGDREGKRERERERERENEEIEFGKIRRASLTKAKTEPGY